MYKYTGKFQIITVGTGDPGRPPLLSGFLKTYIESRKNLKGKVCVDVLIIKSYKKIENIISKEPDMVIFSPHEDWDNHQMFLACKKVKSSLPHTYIVVCAENPRNRIHLDEVLPSDNIDFVIHGESEGPLAELVNHFLTGQPCMDKVRGIISLAGGKVKYHNPYPPITNLDDISSPYIENVFDLYPFRSAEIIISRGCKFHCHYCAINEGGVRYFSLDRIRTELETLIKKAPYLEEIAVTVFDIFANPWFAKSVLTVFRQITDKKGIKFKFDLNVNTIGNPELLKLINNSQFYVDVGVQSINPDVLDACARPSNIELIKNNVALLKKYSPMTHVTISLIRGLPEDTLKGYQNTLNWAISTGYDIAVNHFRVLPGTGFDKKRELYQIKTGKRYPYFVTATRTIPNDDMEKMILLTERVGGILKFLGYSELFKKEFNYLATGLQNVLPFSFLIIADEFYQYLEKTDIFAEMLKVYFNHRKIQMNRSLDWDMESVGLKKVLQKDLMREYLVFQRKTLKKYTKKVGVLTAI